MQRYEKYKDSGVDWIGEIPESWKLIKVKFFCDIYNGDSLNETQKKSYSSENSEHLAYISSKDIDVNFSTINYESGLRIPKGTNFKIATKNSTLLCIEGGSAGRKIAFTNQEVSFVNKLACLKSKKNVNSKFIFYSLKGLIFRTQFFNSLTGLIGGVSISNIKNFNLSFPPISEQQIIVNFLDDKTSKIDQTIANKQKQIELLKERRQIIIQKAVTKGLDETVPLKDSGVDWIGKIPEHWEVSKVKYILKERNERSSDGNEPLLMMSQTYGLVVRADYHSKSEVAKSSEGNKIVRKGDLVFNKLKAHLGVFYKSNIEFNGIVSPDYAVYYSTGVLKDLKFLELLFRNPKYINEFICRATGIVEGLIRLYTADLFDIYVSVPPDEQQIEILKYLEEIEEKIAKAILLKQQEIEKLKEYKTVLIDNVVTGKVRVS